MQIRIENNRNVAGGGAPRWTAWASPITTDAEGRPAGSYIGEGDDPLEAALELCRVLGKVIEYERSHAVAYAGEALKAGGEPTP